MLYDDQKDHNGHSTLRKESKVGNEKLSRCIELFKEDPVDFQDGWDHSGTLKY